ncbi:MAG: RNA 2',3'-cyclic phosphodiesterase [Candidatus Paceibacterota bacterium]|jgi:2'-5' RNA ligase
MKRLFIAINPPKEIKYQIDAICEDLKPKFPEARFIPAENLHITLTFLGDQSDESIGPILESIKKTIFAVEPLQIELENSIFASPKKPANKIWLMATEQTSKKLKELKDKLDNELIKNSIRFNAENWGFNAHITLARSHQNTDIKGLSAESNKAISEERINFEATSIDLIESMLYESGAEYEILEKVDFKRPK